MSQGSKYHLQITNDLQTLLLPPVQCAVVDTVWVRGAEIRTSVRHFSAAALKLRACFTPPPAPTPPNPPPCLNSQKPITQKLLIIMRHTEEARWSSNGFVLLFVLNMQMRCLKYVHNPH